MQFTKSILTVFQIQNFCSQPASWETVPPQHFS